MGGRVRARVCRFFRNRTFEEATIPATAYDAAFCAASSVIGPLRKREQCLFLLYGTGKCRFFRNRTFEEAPLVSCPATARISVREIERLVRAWRMWVHRAVPEGEPTERRSNRVNDPWSFRAASGKTTLSVRSICQRAPRRRTWPGMRMIRLRKKHSRWALDETRDTNLE